MTAWELIGSFVTSNEDVLNIWVHPQRGEVSLTIGDDFQYAGGFTHNEADILALIDCLQDALARMKPALDFSGDRAHPICRCGMTMVFAPANDPNDTSFEWICPDWDCDEDELSER